MDRNLTLTVRNVPIDSSLSARRAWIEISRAETAKTSNAVALRKESVDRNRRYPACCVGLLVALRKESVDRNTQRRDFKALGLRRSPQGERG